MGTWGVGLFDNDDAGEIGDDIASSRDFGVLEQTLDLANEAGSEYLEAPDAQRALVAAEVVAALIGRPSASHPASGGLEDWINRMMYLDLPPALAAKARAATSRVLAEPSELLELWSESGDAGEWRATVEDLVRRLT